MLENTQHEFSCFVTLTYSNDHLPAGGTLVPRDAQLFLKRLRKKLGERKIRFYLVGEYGEQTFRPHYHAALFGVSTLDKHVVSACWPHGSIHVGDLNDASAAYMGGYITKKMTKVDDERLEGRHPEFARMSLRPGIGATAVQTMADVLTTKNGSLIVARTGDVPNEINYGERKTLPIGRYLKAKLRGSLGLPQLGMESPALQQANARLQDLLVGYEKAPAHVKKSVLINRTEPRASRREKRLKIFNSNKRRPL